MFLNSINFLMFLILMIFLFLQKIRDDISKLLLLNVIEDYCSIYVKYFVRYGTLNSPLATIEHMSLSVTKFSKGKKMLIRM